MLNFGNIKYKMSQFIAESYLTENYSKAEALYRDYIQTVKGSPLLMMEYIVFKNLERKNIANNLAYQFIDENVAVFKKHTKSELIAEHAKLKKFDLPQIKLTSKAKLLNESIQNLISENSKANRLPNINKIHDAVSMVLEGITTESVDGDSPSAGASEGKYAMKAIMSAIKKKFADSYKTLTTEEQEAVDILMEKDLKKQENMFNVLKQKGVDFINESTVGAEDKKLGAERIKSMGYDVKTIKENVFGIYELIN